YRPEFTRESTHDLDGRPSTHLDTTHPRTHPPSEHTSEPHPRSWCALHQNTTSTGAGAAGGPRWSTLNHRDDQPRRAQTAGELRDAEPRLPRRYGHLQGALRATRASLTDQQTDRGCQEHIGSAV